MILNVIREGEIDNNTKGLNFNNVGDLNNDKVQLKRLKELLDEEELRYVSPNIRQLLDITKPNDLTCFNSNGKVACRVVQVGERFRVILYIRLSQEDGDLEDGDVSGSIKNQLQLLLDECKSKNWKVVGIFCEEDISGCDDNRPEWLKAIRFAEVGNTEIVLCKSQSRFTRSMEMVEKYLHKSFPEWNVRFLGLVDKTDSNDQESKKSRQINGLVNEWYVEDASKNTRATLNNMKKNGQFTGSVAPYGYLIDPNDKHHLIPDLYAREAVRLMANLLKQGKSMRQVIDTLMEKRFLTPADYKTEKGLPVNRGKNRVTNLNYQVEERDTLQSLADKFYLSVEEIKQKNNLSSNTISKGDILIIPFRQRWTPKMIRTIMTDETQIGTLVQGKTERRSFKDSTPVPKPKSEWIRVPHCHEANLDLETFEIVSKMFNKESKRRPQKNGEVSIFIKKVYCGCCGKSFVRNTSNVKSGKKEYLMCKSKVGVCDNRESIDLKEFTEYITTQIKDMIKEYYDVNKISKEYYSKNVYQNLENDINNLNKEKDNILKNIDKKKTVLMKIYDDKVNGVITDSEFNILKEGNSKELEKLNYKVTDINNRINQLKADKEHQIEKEKIFEEYKDIKSLNRVILDAFIKRIIIEKANNDSSERKIKIEWNFHTI